jgi:16S rRNA (cytidine1402-2'-O)-methyltransferase
MPAPASLRPSASPLPPGSPGPGLAPEGSAAPLDPAGPGSAGARGSLYVVSTPIGNLGDVGFRALETLRSVPLVAAEDTRMTMRLFARYELRTRLISYHARNAMTRGPELLGHLRGGGDLALVTDAGTPLVSDPGASLVADWAAEGGRVIPIPGASAALAALVASGVAGPRWTFEGFLPRSGRERRERLAAIAADPRASIIYESPERVSATLADLADACGPERPAAVCRELTKLHEEVRRGPLGTLAADAREGRATLRGEFVVVVGQGDPAARPVPAGSSGGLTAVTAGAAGAATDPLAAARAEVERLVAGGVARGEAAKLVAKATGIPRRQLYGTPGEG